MIVNRRKHVLEDYNGILLAKTLHVFVLLCLLLILNYLGADICPLCRPFLQDLAHTTDIGETV